MGNKFSPLPRKHDKVFRGTIDKNNNSFSPDEFHIKLKNHHDNSLSDVPNFCRASLLTMNKRNLKNTAVLLQDNLYDDRESICFQ